MLINSLTFWIFMALIAVPMYTALMHNRARYQNVWLLLASYVFYGYADWRTLPLLAVTTVVYYALGIGIDRANKAGAARRASWLTAAGVVLGVGVLFYFKYLGFCVRQFAELFSQFGLDTSGATFAIVVPVGISFFTFKLISYVIEVNRETLAATRRLDEFALYVAFFPTIMSGPIDRPGQFLPQLKQPRRADATAIADGAKRVLWGWFAKVCIADRLMPYTDAVINNPEHHNGASITLAAVLYLIQMYADFAGYSDMAIGTAQMLGLRVAENFKRPFFARNIAEYWQRWHITLTTWLTDYVFMPLNIKFRSLGMTGLYLATMINLLLIGMWHGPNWTYALFGIYHGVLLCVTTALDRPRKKWEKRHGLRQAQWYAWLRRLLTFVLCCWGALLFRSNSIGDFALMTGKMISEWGPLYTQGTTPIFSLGLLSILILAGKEYNDEMNKGVHLLHNRSRVIRLATVTLLVAFIVFTGVLEGATFIYFQF